MNRFRKKYKVLVFAFFLTLMHAFIPHVHSQQTTPPVLESHNASEDLLVVFTRALTFNLGQHHLENFRDSGNHDLTIASPFIISLAAIIALQPLNIVEEPLPKNEFLLPETDFCNSHIVRGPPSFRFA